MGSVSHIVAGSMCINKGIWGAGEDTVLVISCMNISTEKVEGDWVNSSVTTGKMLYLVALGSKEEKVHIEQLTYNGPKIYVWYWYKFLYGKNSVARKAWQL